MRLQDRLSFVVLTVAMICGTSTAVSAQTTANIPANTPFRLVGTWTDAQAQQEGHTAYRCYLASAQVGTDLPPSARAASGDVTCQFAGLSPGTYIVGLSAVNTFGEGPQGTATATAGNPPSTPTNLRIEVVVTIVQQAQP